MTICWAQALDQEGVETSLVRCPSCGLAGGCTRERQTQRRHLSMGHADDVPPSAVLVRGRKRSVDMHARPCSACPQFNRAVCDLSPLGTATQHPTCGISRPGPSRNAASDRRPDDDGLVWRFPATTRNAVSGLTHRLKGGQRGPSFATPYKCSGHATRERRERFRERDHLDELGD